MYPHIKTGSALTVIIADIPHAITVDHKNYEKVLKIVRNKQPKPKRDERLIELIKPIAQFMRVIGTENSGFILADGMLKCKIDGEDFPLATSLYNEILDIYNENGNLEPLYNFVTKLARNPRKEVIDELWGFISSCGLSITESGNFLAYKNVNTDFKDVYTGKIDNSPGQIISMPRWQVEHNPDKTCAAGLHFAAWGYLKSYAPGRKTVILSISPEDVVSIPTDYDNMKGRACGYKILREVAQPEELKGNKVYTDDGVKVSSLTRDEWIENSEEAVDLLNEYDEVEVEFLAGDTTIAEVGYLDWSIDSHPGTIVRFRLV